MLRPNLDAEQCGIFTIQCARLNRFRSTCTIFPAGPSSGISWIPITGVATSGGSQFTQWANPGPDLSSLKSEMILPQDLPLLPFSRPLSPCKLSLLEPCSSRPTFLRQTTSAAHEECADAGIRYIERGPISSKTWH